MLSIGNKCILSTSRETFYSNRHSWWLYQGVPSRYITMTNPVQETQAKPHEWMDIPVNLWAIYSIFDYNCTGSKLQNTQKDLLVGDSHAIVCYTNILFEVNWLKWIFSLQPSSARICDRHYYCTHSQIQKLHHSRSGFYINLCLV